MKSNKYKYVLLDWDGNLAKTLDVWLVAFRTVLECRGVHKTDEQIAASFGLFETYIATWGVKDIDKAIDEADEIAKRQLPHVALYPDALEVLQWLHDSGRKLALVTTSGRDKIEEPLRAHNITQFFDVIVTGDEVAHVKPHPESLDRALVLLGGTKTEAVMIGDTDKDIGAANNAGIDSILFFPPEHTKFYDAAELKKLHPTHIVDDFRRVMTLV